MNMKKKIVFVLAGFVFASVFCLSGSAQEKTQSKFIASTSWTAAFADLAGVDNVSAIAPANLKHPPEYEITVSDIQKIMQSDFFIYAGFERMMRTLGSSVQKSSAQKPEMIQISLNNSIETVRESTRKIAEIAGTQKENEKRLEEYVLFIKNASAELEKNGLKGAKVLVNINQRFLAEDLGFNVIATFGPEPVTSSQILDAKNGNYIFIIDNVHNPVGSPLSEVSPNAKYIAWRNFPEKTERNALLNMIKENVGQLKNSDSDF